MIYYYFFLQAKIFFFIFFKHILYKSKLSKQESIEAFKIFLGIHKNFILASSYLKIKAILKVTYAPPSKKIFMH